MASLQVIPTTHEAKPWPCVLDYFSAAARTKDLSLRSQGRESTAIVWKEPNNPGL